MGLLGRRSNPRPAAVSSEEAKLILIREDFATDRIDIDEFERRTMEVLKAPEKLSQWPKPDPMTVIGSRIKVRTPGYHDLYEKRRRDGPYTTTPTDRILAGLTTRNDERLRLALPELPPPSDVQHITLNLSEASNRLKALYGIPEHYVGTIPY